MYFHWDGRRGVTLAHTEPWAQIRMGGRKARAAVKGKKRGHGGGRKKKRYKFMENVKRNGVEGSVHYR